MLLITGLVAVSAHGHAPWVQAGTNLIRTDDVSHINLMLGNHGKEHRDFKLAPKIGLDGVKAVEIFGPEGFR